MFDTITHHETIEHLDFEPELACEHSCHGTEHAGDEPASWMVFGMCPSCGRHKKYTLCEPGRVYLFAVERTRCPECSHVHRFVDVVVSIEAL